MDTPKRIENPNTEKLITAIEDYFNFLKNNYIEDRDSDWTNYVFETAVEAFYENPWKWVNERTK